uniref:Proline and serine rich coiled-coil 1 n=1 Tax=Rattus norvegicus TaxID=10116 RepID=A0ABK0LQ44_RAT
MKGLSCHHQPPFVFFYSNTISSAEKTGIKSTFVISCVHLCRSKLTRLCWLGMEDLKEDIKFIVDETLDFGGLSPSDSHEEEDITVLVSPEKPLRRGLSHRSNPNAVAPALQGVRFSLGPLSPEKLEEILDEANRLAAQLEECALKDSENAAAGPGRPSPRGKPSPRRETFVLKDSPVRDLLPTVSSWSAPPPSNLTGLRSSDKKGSARAGRVTAGKKPSSIKKESPTCNLFSASKNPGRSPLAQPTLPPRRKTGSGARTVASETWAAQMWVKLIRGREELGPTLTCVYSCLQAHQSLSGQLHSPQLATPSALPGCREQLPSLQVDYHFPQPSPSLPSECHSLDGVYRLAKVP